MPTLSEVQDYLLKQKTEDEEKPIDNKAKYRVTRAMAEGVKKTNPLKGGRCNFCSREVEKLIPVTMEICPTCATKFIQRGGELKVIKKINKLTFCNFCMVKTFTVFYVNPRVCQYCSNRIGRRHKFDLSEAKKIGGPPRT